MIRIATFFLMILLWMPVAAAQEIYESEEHKFRLVSVAGELEHPWALDFLPNGDLLVSERPGRLNIIRKNGQRHEVKGLPEIAANAQGGLLDVLVHPEFAANQLIYFSYSAGSVLSGYGTEVARARLNGPRLEDLEIIFKAEPKTAGRGLHFGSRLVIGADDKLYITLGDRFRMNMAQDPSNHMGTIIRLNQDGSVPEDNPFVGRAGYRPEIYTYGNRNVQGAALRVGHDQIWFHEHGPRGGDELNILRSGANYGWPAVTHGIDYSGVEISDKTGAPGMEEPVIHWTPSIAPSGMAFYDGDRFPEWRGNIFLGALAHTHLRRVVLDGDRVVHQEVLLQEKGERIRDVMTGPDGFLYILTDSPYGEVLRLEPAS